MNKRSRRRVKSGPRHRTHPGAGYVNTFPALLDKYLMYLTSGHKIPDFVFLAFLGCVFLQDNSTGTLQDWQGLLAALLKYTLVMRLYTAYLQGGSACGEALHGEGWR